MKDKFDSHAVRSTLTAVLYRRLRADGQPLHGENSHSFGIWAGATLRHAVVDELLQVRTCRIIVA